jgi:homoserine O-acetyltransferase/O-succinyltransferase
MNKLFGSCTRFAPFLLLAIFTVRNSGAQELKIASLGDLKLQSGEILKDCRIGYRTFGHLNAARNNAVLFPSWFSGKSEDLQAYVGADKMLAPEKDFIILVDALADGVSSSPSNSPAQSKAKFPRVTIRDMVNSEYLLATKELGLTHLHAVIGISMGGMQTFQWAVSYPDFLDVAIPIVGTPRQSSYDLLLWNSEVSAIEQRLKNGDEANALQEAEMISWMHLTTPTNFATETKRENFEKELEQDEKDAKAHNDPYDYLAQLRAMIAHDVSPPGGTVADAAKLVKARMLVIAARQDQMVNPLAALSFAELRKAPTLVLESDCGHLAPGCQSGVVALAVRGALDQK